MVMGFLLAAFRLRQNSYRLLLLWPLLTVIIAGALVIESPQSHRLVMATPALALLAALALITLGNLILAALQQSATRQEDSLPDLSQEQLGLPNGRKPLAQASLVLVGLVLLFALNDLLFYYGRFPNNNQFADTNTEIAYELTTYLNNLEGDWTAYLYGPPVLYIDFPTLPYLLVDFQAGANLFNVESAGAPLIPAPTTNQLFIFLPQRESEMADVQQQFPGGNWQQVNGYYASPLFTIYQFQP
jgi:hypothetical protein